MKYTAASAIALAATGAAADSWGSSSTTTTTTTTTTTKSTTTDPSGTWGDWSSSSTTSSKPTTNDPSGTWGDWTSSTTSVEPATATSADPNTWADWKGTSVGSGVNCPATLTVVKTATATVYAATSEIYKDTVVVPAPTAPQTVTIDPVWADWKASSSSSADPSWGDWKASSSSVVPVTTLPAGCNAKTTVTSTATSTSTKAGTTTIYKSTLFVGAGVGAPIVTVTGSGHGSGWGSGSGAGSSAVAAVTGGSWGIGNGNSGSGNGNGNYDGGNGNGNHGSGNGNGNYDGGNGNGNYGSGNGNDHSNNGHSGNGNGPLRPGLGGVSSVIGQNGDVYTWTVPDSPSGTKSWDAPEYTRGPDGSWSGGPRPHGGSSGNGTTPSGGNGTLPTPGSPSSNVTRPFDHFRDTECNKAGSRDKWCRGKSIDTDYYQDYFSGQDCVYDLTITNGTFNHDGTDVLTFLINGQSPGPAIECNWGDIVKVTVHNQLENNGTTIHWHGIRQRGTNDQDGVPGVTECAIAPGSSRTYTWHASSYGTAWYHSHWGTQLGDGIRGPIVIHGPATADYDVDAGPIMIDDTFPRTVAAQADVIAHTGPGGTVNYLLNGKNTKADLSAGQHALWNVKAGKKYLFRLINSATQNMYSVSLDGHKFTVIAADLVPIVPYQTTWLNIGIGQRYDVVIEFNQAVDNYFFRAVTQTGCPSGCANTGLGSANGIFSYEGASLLLPTTTPNGNKTIADFAFCKDEPLASLVPHVKKSAGTSSAFGASVSTIPGGQVATFQTAEDDTVFRWFLNNGAININYTQPTLKSLSQGFASNNSVISNPITLKQKNQWVYFVIQNQFFASHPMHLHGHDHSVLGQGGGLFTADMVSTLNFDNPIRRDTSMLQGSAGPTQQAGYTVIGFETDNPGAWLMHCHIVWHVDGGLALQWIERPDEINADKYTSTAQFQDECSAYASYEAQGTYRQKTSGQSGLKARGALYFDEQVASFAKSFNNVVRRDDAAHRYLDTHNMKRGFGDGFHHARHFGARR